MNNDLENEKIGIIIGKPTFYSEGTSTSYSYQNLTELTFDDPNFTKKEKLAFLGPIKYQIVTSGISGLARYSNKGYPIGNWVQLRKMPNPEIAKTSLAIKEEYKNTCEECTKVTIPKGVRLAVGEIRDGTEEQIYIHSKDLKYVSWEISE